ncbi:hypothetical protein IWQ62_005032 [Dispira parvispora]|uniref:Uncharacterized protein n=1 Tax=Dispira parvispora TaxID=1520584 RepID=A0A9W8AQQ2_9FUNG|nr:hypothetical protein IWQ62_005032 [Dispira parvispora]
MDTSNPVRGTKKLRTTPPSPVNENFRAEAKAPEDQLELSTNDQLLTNTREGTKEMTSSTEIPTISSKVTVPDAVEEPAVGVEYSGEELLQAALTRPLEDYTDDYDRMCAIRTLEKALEVFRWEASLQSSPSVTPATPTTMPTKVPKQLTSRFWYNFGLCLSELSVQVGYIPYTDEAIQYFQRAFDPTLFPTCDDPRLFTEVHFAWGKALLFKAALADVETQRLLLQEGITSDFSADEFESDDSSASEDDNDGSSHADGSSGEEDSDEGPSASPSHTAPIDLKQTPKVATTRESRESTPSSSQSHDVPEESRIDNSFSSPSMGDKATLLTAEAMDHLDLTLTKFDQQPTDEPATHMALLIAHTLVKYLLPGTGKKFNRIVYTNVVRYFEQIPKLDPNFQLDTSSAFLFYRSQFMVLRYSERAGRFSRGGGERLSQHVDRIITHLLELADPANNRDGKGKQPATPAHTRLHSNICKLLGQVYLFASNLEDDDDRVLDLFDRAKDALEKAQALNPDDVELEAQLEDLGVEVKIPE